MLEGWIWYIKKLSYIFTVILKKDGVYGMNQIDLADYRRRVLGCWLGKAVGGTLGGPVEGKEGPLSLTFYDPIPDQMLPNDDLDLQVVWLEAIRRHGLPIERHMLASTWLEHIHFWPDEYGVASRNLYHGISPPISGWFDNGFTAGMGAAIRTEIWACLAPGDPELAATLAREDACVDHAAEGVYAARYLAAIESAAFIENDQEKLLHEGKNVIPSGSRVARAIEDTRAWWSELHDWQEVRKLILREHGRQNFTDVAQNLAFIVLGWLAGEGDFGKSICTAVNCGKDTDCTGATLGALLGILNPDGIDNKWLKPIGKDLLLSPGIVGMHNANTLDDFTEKVAGLAIHTLAYYKSNITLSNADSITHWQTNISPPRNCCHKHIMLGEKSEPTESLVATEPLIVYVNYPLNVALSPEKPAGFYVKVINPSKHHMDIHLRIRVPDGWISSLSYNSIKLDPGQAENIRFSITPPGNKNRVYRNLLDLCFELNNMQWTVSAGLINTIPWLRWPISKIPDECPKTVKDAELLEVAGHFQRLPKDPHALTADFIIPHDQTMRYIVQAPREVKVWIDGTEINHHKGTYLVPAIHRCGETGKDLKLKRGWHKMTIAVGDGDDCELFTAIGDGESWDWLRDIEWRVPVGNKW
ncbi:hypothetical protein GF312_18080 [Candidatus Poribacteria bacterium]|nr:hypothetical protein [Candidatus Poribacteria bacterium]